MEELVEEPLLEWLVEITDRHLDANVLSGVLQMKIKLVEPCSVNLEHLAQRGQQVRAAGTRLSHEEYVTARDDIDGVEATKVLDCAPQNAQDISRTPPLPIWASLLSRVLDSGALACPGEALEGLSTLPMPLRRQVAFVEAGWGPTKVSVPASSEQVDVPDVPPSTTSLGDRCDANRLRVTVSA